MPSTQRLRRAARTVVLTALAGAAASVAGIGPASPAGAATPAVVCVSRPAPIAPHARVRVVSEVAHGRLRTYTMRSPAVGVTHVNVLLPVGYGRDPARRYPVLYLLHGALGS